MAGALDDFFSSIGQGISSVATTVTSDVDSFVSGAQTNVAQLLNSGVNSRGQITGPLAEHFGSDPVTFAVNASKHFDTFFRAVCNRVALRTGNASFDVDLSQRGDKGKIPARVGRKSTSAEVALVVALNATHHPAILIEEAGRMQQGLEVKRGLDGPYVYYPPVGGMTARGFFGIDEAAAAAAALTILVAIGPALIGALVAIVGAIAPEVAAGIGGLLGGEPPPPPPSGLFGIDGLDPMMAAIIAAAVVVGGFLLVRHRMAA